MAMHDDLVAIIDERIERYMRERNASDPTRTAKISIARGLLVTRIDNTHGSVQLDGSSNAVPMPVCGDLVANAGDRIIALRTGDDWVVALAFPHH